jgi:hypothetical protein
MLQVGLEPEFLGEGISKLFQVMRAKVESAVAPPAHHVVVASMSVGQLIVKAVPYRHLRNHSQVSKQVEGPVYRGDIHIRIGFLGPLKHLVHPHVAIALGHYSQHD